MTQLNYKQEGDYLIPDLTLPEQEPKPLGRYGRARMNFLKEHKSVTYTELMATGTLNTHLWDIEQQANERAQALIAQMMENEGATEELKVSDQMAWVGLTSNIKQRAQEITMSELVYS